LHSGEISIHYESPSNFSALQLAIIYSMPLHWGQDIEADVFATFRSILGAFLSIGTSHSDTTQNDLFEFVLRIGGAVFGFPIIKRAHCYALYGSAS
jgi:hypothetical protein